MTDLREEMRDVLALASKSWWRDDPIRSLYPPEVELAELRDKLRETIGGSDPNGKDCWKAAQQLMKKRPLTEQEASDVLGHYLARGDMATVVGVAEAVQKELTAQNLLVCIKAQVRRRGFVSQDVQQALDCLGSKYAKRVASTLLNKAILDGYCRVNALADFTEKYLGRSLTQEEIRTGYKNAQDDHGKVEWAKHLTGRWPVTDLQRIFNRAVANVAIHMPHTCCYINIADLAYGILLNAGKEPEVAGCVRAWFVEQYLAKDKLDLERAAYWTECYLKHYWDFMHSGETEKMLDEVWGKLEEGMSQLKVHQLEFIARVCKKKVTTDLLLQLLKCQIEACRAEWARDTLRAIAAAGHREVVQSLLPDFAL